MANRVVIQTPFSTLIGQIEDPSGELFTLDTLQFTVISASAAGMGAKKRYIVVKYSHYIFTNQHVYRVYQLGELGEISIRTVHEFFKQYQWYCRYR